VPALRIGCGLAVGLAVWWSPSAARAWATVEHQEIGRASYLQACAELSAAVAGRGAPSPAVAIRLDTVCGRTLATNAEIYGDATAIAGDFLSEPSEFISQAGFWRFKSRTSYWLLALENDEHFNPKATRSWADYHAAAVDEALAGAAADGLASVERLERAIHESAFADHFLQDAFAAGHMGFNRSASPAAASKSFHDAWNARGRVVCNRAGGRWVTFGDGRLDRPENQDGRRHVLDAATASVRNVLRAFVLGERSPAEELDAWRALPFAIEAPELNVGVVELFERQQDSGDRRLVPLVATVRPARKDTVLTARLWSAASFSHPDDDVIAAVAGFELAIPRVPAQSYLGAGATLRDPRGVPSFVADSGLVFPVGLSLRTLLSHQLNTTASWMIRDHLAVVIHAEYQLNVELGDVLLSGLAGLAELLPDRRTGWFAAAGLGFTFSAAGGGAL
jgi:hypothetical protein